MQHPEGERLKHLGPQRVNDPDWRALIACNIPSSDVSRAAWNILILSYINKELQVTNLIEGRVRSMADS